MWRRRLPDSSGSAQRPPAAFKPGLLQERLSAGGRHDVRAEKQRTLESTPFEPQVHVACLALLYLGPSGDLRCPAGGLWGGLGSPVGGCLGQAVGETDVWFRTSL